MYIISKEKGIILNFDCIVEVFAGGTSGSALVAKQTDGKIIPMQEYESKELAKEAVALIAEEIGRKDVVYVPDKDAVKGRIVNSNVMREQHHNIGGKKTKGHGGS